MWATFDVAHLAGRKITIVEVVGALSPCERRQPFPPCLCAFPPCGAQSPSPSFPPAARRIAECANAQPKSARFRYRRFLFGRGAGRAHSPRFPLRRLPYHRGSRFLRSRSPRHASRRADEFPTVGRRGWSRSSREGTASGGMRVWECLPSVLSASRREKIVSAGCYCAETGEEMPR